MKKSIITQKDLRLFYKSYDYSHEDNAAIDRGRFIKAFPIRKLKNITIDEYIVGKGGETFCNFVEAKTKNWANIQGSTAFKFGVYYGKVKSDPRNKYRFTKKFGNSKEEAFESVRKSLVDLISAGKRHRYDDVDSNLLSQMFKAKTLSLYFPDEYLNICSSEHISAIALELDLPRRHYSSQYQNDLIRFKKRNRDTRRWSNPKFMSFLFSRYIRDGIGSKKIKSIRKPRSSPKRRINFEDINNQRDAIGKISEKFAIEWEKNRLIGLGWENLVNKIDDRTNRPAYGYDFLSFTTPKTERYIEVKSFAKTNKSGGYRFFLSENEKVIPESREH